MTDRIRKQWEALGREDPYWAVITRPDKKGRRWDKRDFFRTGVDEVDRVMREVQALGVEVLRGVALDFGCGVGRVTQALAARFERVFGVDIAQSMLDEARAQSRSANVDFMRNDGETLTQVASESIDFLYSNLALQHAPRGCQRSLAREFCRVLRPGAVLVIQTPSHPNPKTGKGWAYLLFRNRALNVARRLLHGRGRVMEIHTFDKAQVVRTLEQGGLSLLDVRRNDAAGAAFVSYRYFARKPPA